MQAADVEFIAKSWPHLSLISWTLHVDENVARKLRPILLKAFPTISKNEMDAENAWGTEGEEAVEEQEGDSEEWEDEEEDDGHEDEAGPAVGSMFERLVETAIAYQMPSAVDYRAFIAPPSHHGNDSHTLIDRSDEGPSAWPL